MNTHFRYFLLLIFSALFLVSCDDEDDGPKGQYQAGVFIVNEGNFGADNGSVTFYNETSETAEQNIFRNASGAFAGDVVQSLTFSGDNAFLVINEDDKIEMVNAHTFASIETITSTEIEKPRYVEVINGKAYISVWGDYDVNYSLVDSYILVYDISSKTFVKKIDTDEGTENMLYNGQRLFASNNNFGGSSTVSVINPADNSLVDEVEVGDGPAGMTLDANGKVWVICVGGYGADQGHLYRINPTSLAVEEEITINGSVGVDIAVTPNKQNILYTAGTSVYKLAITATAEAAEPLFEATDIVSISTLNVDPSSGDIWLGDAPSFTSVGKVYIYSADGDMVSSFDAGISPTQIVFKR